MKVKFVDLETENNVIKKTCLKKIAELANSSAFTLGPEVRKFEKNFACFCEAKFCLGVGSGTDALRTALLACGIGKGDEVITSSISYASTPLAIVHCGGKPVFVDVLENSNIDHTKIEAAITKKTKAILVVHMYGNICEMSQIRLIARKHKLFLIDDCAHAQGASYKGRVAGSLADISCFSFYPTKNLGAWGDAGAVTTNDRQLYKKACLYKNYGELAQNYSLVIGYNSKLDAVQAAVLGEKIKYLKLWNKKRSIRAKRYTQALRGVGDVKTLQFSENCSYYNFPINTGCRDALREFLK
ncbi:MAG: DegT/DnrJ/EryC1/StrS family aminotransferase, partial [Proteobacteria bacterium]|nr:DegT/DnrJ/EryC1/StrS family aminotransferase [Pseudomonadota bacterium]